MTDMWSTKPVLELDISTAAVYVESAERQPKAGGRWLVVGDEVWWGAA